LPYIKAGLTQALALGLKKTFFFLSIWPRDNFIFVIYRFRVQKYHNDFAAQLARRQRATSKFQAQNAIVANLVQYFISFSTTHNFYLL
jgi:hypothetical protein